MDGLIRETNPALELSVDLFAGAGGASKGLSVGYHEPDVAVNHSPEAVAVHRANHSGTTHFTCDVFEVDPVEVTGGRPVGVLWASPDCRHHSKAAGGKPRSKKVRALAWVVVRWAEQCRPRLILLENVEEFADWGPLLPDGSPDKVRKGFTFRRWKKALEDLGYVIEHRELVAADYGAPTIRKRLYLVARCDGQPIVWPEPTHARHPTGALKPWRTAAECIDFDVPATSIFARPRPLVENTLKRVAKGLWRFVLNCPAPFTLPCGPHDMPVDGEPHGARKASFFEQANGGFYDGDGRAATAPLSTICTSGANQRLVSAYLIKYYGNERDGVPLTEPMHTIPTKDLMGLIQCLQLPPASLSAAQRRRACDVASFFHAFLPEHFTEPCEAVAIRDYVLADITLRMLTPAELAKAQGFPDGFIVDRGLYETAPGSGVFEPRPITKTNQVRLIGNSVCPDVAAALVRANAVVSGRICKVATA